jgi:hypothetical protein
MQGTHQPTHHTDSCSTLPLHRSHRCCNHKCRRSHPRHTRGHGNHGNSLKARPQNPAGMKGTRQQRNQTSKRAGRTYSSGQTLVLARASSVATATPAAATIGATVPVLTVRRAPWQHVCTQNYTHLRTPTKGNDLTAAMERCQVNGVAARHRLVLRGAQNSDCACTTAQFRAFTCAKTTKQPTLAQRHGRIAREIVRDCPLVHGARVWVPRAPERVVVTGNTSNVELKRET